MAAAAAALPPSFELLTSQLDIYQHDERPGAASRHRANWQWLQWLGRHSEEALHGCDVMAGGCSCIAWVSVMFLVLQKKSGLVLLDNLLMGWQSQDGSVYVKQAKLLGLSVLES